MREVQLKTDFALPVEELLQSVDDNTKLIFLCSPNNPTGNSFPREDILRIVEEFEGVVVVDEAYIDFAEAKTLVDDIATHPNLVVLQTMSKAWGMAGLRVGLALADSCVVAVMSQVKYPYNINLATMHIVEELLDEPLQEHVAEIKMQRRILSSALRSMSFVERVYPSDANFVLVKVADADALYDYLIADGIIVRNRNRVKGCEGSLRISVGTPHENEKLIKSLEKYEESVVR